MAHRWSGWPGAWCLDCGIPDPGEMAIAEGWDPTDDELPVFDWYCDVCPEPGSKRCDPYRNYDVSVARLPESEPPPPNKDWMLKVIVGVYAAAIAGVVTTLFRK